MNLPSAVEARHRNNELLQDSITLGEMLKHIENELLKQATQRYKICDHFHVKENFSLVVFLDHLKIFAIFFLIKVSGIFCLHVIE